ncbi:RDD family protein [Marinilactibacillus sp. Marseille-P9653]|uniref:RDD family protein n=1 Tax=Marinilactibacillus sp. Marseille-P9653 TaxID=2866583 RepID=UPI001CE4AA5C|nr:RDD family protein [Marinilactibacillus sp. Marseille-P9653]
MKKYNSINWSIRLKELVVDYVAILVYLIGLLIVNLIIYFFVLDGVPNFTMDQAKIVATVESVIPIVIWFTVMDYKKPFGTFGKRKAKLEVVYMNRSFWRSLIRNVVKFLPWQLAHLGVIEGIYTEFETIGSILLTNAGILLGLILFGMGFFRKDRRHLGDLLAGTQVTSKK